VANQAADWLRSVRGAVSGWQHEYIIQDRKLSIDADQVRTFSDVLRDKFCDRLRPARATASDQATSTTGNVVISMDTYVAAFGYADQYNTANDNVHCEEHVDIDHLDCLLTDQSGDEDTSYWWDNGYTALTINNTRNNNVQLSANANESVPDNSAERNTETLTKYSIRTLYETKVISSFGSCTDHRSSVYRIRRSASLLERWLTHHRWPPHLFLNDIGRLYVVCIDFSQLQVVEPIKINKRSTLFYIV
jgi:hypothetical protein